MLQPQHSWFVECHLNSECVASSPSLLALLFAHQLLDEESDITGDNGVQQDASIFVNSMQERDL